MTEKIKNFFMANKIAVIAGAGVLALVVLMIIVMKFTKPDNTTPTGDVDSGDSAYSEQSTEEPPTTVVVDEEGSSHVYEIETDKNGEEVTDSSGEKVTKPYVPPTDPTKPTDNKPTGDNPTNSTSPTKPTESTKPTDPTKPTDKPTDPTKPTEKPTTPPTEKPTEKPTDPTKPTEKPTEPEKTYDIQYFADYAIKYGKSIGLILMPDVTPETGGWDNPIMVKKVADESERKRRIEDIEGRINRLKREGDTHFWVYYEVRDSRLMNLYIGY